MITLFNRNSGLLLRFYHLSLQISYFRWNHSWFKQNSIFRQFRFSTIRLHTFISIMRQPLKINLIRLIWLIIAASCILIEFECNSATGCRPCRYNFCLLRGRFYRLNVFGLQIIFNRRIIVVWDTCVRWRWNFISFLSQKLVFKSGFTIVRQNNASDPWRWRCARKSISVSFGTKVSLFGQNLTLL